MHSNETILYFLQCIKQVKMTYSLQRFSSIFERSVFNINKIIIFQIIIVANHRRYTTLCINGYIFAMVPLSFFYTIIQFFSQKHGTSPCERNSQCEHGQPIEQTRSLFCRQLINRNTSATSGELIRRSKRITDK